MRASFLLGVTLLSTSLSATEPVLPPILRGIDGLPDARAVRATPSAALRAVVDDEQASAVARARAARLLGAREVIAGSIDDVATAVVLERLRASDVAELRVQAALAQGDRAARRGQLLNFSSSLLVDEDAGVRGAAVILLWRDRSPAARALLRSHVDDDDAVARQIRRRLDRWSALPAR